jgi:hypothetical protein
MMIVICLSLPLALFAQPQFLGRVVVLELQGEDAPVQTRIQWADLMRSWLVQHYPTFQLISKDAISLLLPQGENLDSCIGACEVEISRKVGANWVISGQITKDQSQKNADLWILTLKLHHADGTLVGIDQKQGSLSKLKDQLEIQFKQVALNLEKIQAQKYPHLYSNSQTQTQTQAQAQAQPQAQTTQKPSDRNALYLPKAQLCISHLITAQDYFECVQDQVCTIGEQGGKCAFDQNKPKTATAPMNCISFAQAHQWISWRNRKHARLAIEKEWDELADLCKDCIQKDFEEWTAQVFKANPAQVELAGLQNPNTDPNILIKTMSFSGQITRSQIPPSFSHSRLGFRYVFRVKDQKDCQVQAN